MRLIRQQQQQQQGKTDKPLHPQRCTDAGSWRRGNKLLKLQMLTKANSAAKKVKRAVEETSTNAAMGAAAARRGSLENLQTDWVL
eukprot:COSAG02_NODE_33217_length_503_cov_1.277228_1_plen_84_part_01